MFDSCLKKQQALAAHFIDCSSRELRYQRIMDLGREMPALAKEHKIPENLVKGCQSQMHLYTEFRNGLMYFSAESDALISQGLAALLVTVYDGESPETVLRCEPSFLDQLDIASSLSPNRANGLYSLHLRMKQEALQRLSQTGS